jgi:hypothetical protein
MTIIRTKRPIGRKAVDMTDIIDEACSMVATLPTILPAIESKMVIFIKRPFRGISLEIK